MMQLITPEYQELNRLLHADKKDKYGSGSWRHVDAVLQLREDTESNTVLDYGCGKGYLGKALGHPEWLSEYDPAVAGKETPPEHADMVVCTDVLEHVEPDLIDNVLAHIAKIAVRCAFIVIATRKSEKTLADGRNAHLLIRDGAWWREKLADRFFLREVTSDAGETVAICTSVKRIGEMIPKSAVSDTIRYEQAIRNCGVVKDRVGDAPRHDGRVAIVAYGPSLKHTWHYLRTERKAFGTKIVTTSGAHDFLIERGIVPDIHIEVDPREHKGFFTRNSHPDVTYWMASCSHPKTIDNLVNNSRKVALWHVYNSDTDRKIVDADGPDPNGWLICGGGSVACRAINVMYTQGYRSLSVYGMDCSFDIDGNQHAGEHSGKKQHEWSVRIGKRWFRSSATLIYTARGFIQNAQTLARAAAENNEPFIPGTKDRVEFFLHGDGVLQEMYRYGLEHPQEAAA